MSTPALCTVPCSGGAVVATSARRPCMMYKEFSFAPPVRNLECIQFQNYYCQEVRVHQLQAGDASGAWMARLGRRSAVTLTPACGAERWVEVCRVQLMPDPHYEDHAQTWHTLCTENVWWRIAVPGWGAAAAHWRAAVCAVVRRVADKEAAALLVPTIAHVGQGAPPCRSCGGLWPC